MTEIIEYTPSKKLVEEFPEFAKITIYGDSDNPLFPISQVQEFIGAERIRLDKGDYELGIDYVKVVCNRKGGKCYEQNLLTEEGLYHVLFRTKTPVSRKFRHFTTVVMKELRLRGHVTLDGALEKLNREIADRERTIAQQVLQLEDEHNKRMQLQRDSDKFYMQKMAALNRAVAAEMKLNQVQDAPDTSPEHILDRMKAVFLKRVYIHLAKPPKAIEDDFPDFEYTDPVDDEEICFEVSFRSRDQPSCADFFVMKDTKMEQLHCELHDRDFTVTIDGRQHVSKFRGTIDNIRELTDNMLAKALDRKCDMP